MEAIQSPIQAAQIPAKKTFFQKIAVILLDNERKNEVAQEIIEDSNFGKLYRLQLLLSVIICSLWLLINSIPVIIGAMLIAPILKPIKIIAFATATGNGHMYNKGLKISIFSILVSIAIAIIITKITPLATLTPEIYSRISPTIIDLVIALAGGTIAFLSLWFKKLWEWIAWVAMATALIPPLCVTGIGINFLSMEITKWSFLLFLTNFVVIILVGIIIFYAFGFFPTNKKGQKHSIESIFLTVVIVILIITPLTQSMKEITNNIKTKQTIENVTNEFLGNINKKIEIEKISYQTQDDDILRIRATIDVPSTTPITEQQKNDLSKILALSTEKSVNLDLNIVNISSALIEKKEEISNDEVFQKQIQEYIKTYTGITIIESKIAYNPAPLVYMNLFSEKESIKEKVENDIEVLSKETLWTGAKILILRQKENGKEEQQQQIIYYQNIKNFIQENFNGTTYIDSFEVEKNETETIVILTITIGIRSTLNTKEIQNYITNIKKELEANHPEKFTFKVHTTTISEISVE